MATRDRHERRHRRTAKNVHCVKTMAGANFDAVPSLSEAMGLEETTVKNPYGKGEERGPTIELSDLLNPPPAPPKPPCERCDNGMKTTEQMGRQKCPECGRWLFDAP